MNSIAFFNNKGGVGKTTLVCNVAAYLALNYDYKVLVVDADPQCNATQLMLDENDILDIYEKGREFTIHSIIHPLSLGKGYTKDIFPRYVSDFGVDLIPGDPRLALKEDLLSKDWQTAISGDIRGLRTTFVFSELLSKCTAYDFVFFDVGPSLGSINRSVLASCDYFLSPMSIDIFSVMAIENISVALLKWRSDLEHGITRVEDEEDLLDLPGSGRFSVSFIGYVAQQYLQKSSHGQKRMVKAYDRIMKKIPETIEKNFVAGLGAVETEKSYEIGSIPNLHSLIPMSQMAHKPVFELKAKDGVRGAHFNKVRDAGEIFENVSERLLENLGYE